MAQSNEDILKRLISHIQELEYFEKLHLSYLPEGWLKVKPTLKALKKIDEQAIRDLIELHNQNKRYSNLYSKVVPLLIYLHRDLEDLLKQEPTFEEEKHAKIIRELITKIKKIIVDYKWVDKELISKIGSSELIYRKDEDVRYAMMRYFVLADQFKKALSETLGIPQAWHHVLPLSRVDFVHLYRKVYQNVGQLDKKEIIKLVYQPEKIGKGPDQHRVWRFETAKWTVTTINLRDMGVWPSFGGVDHFTTSGNLIDTAKKINMILHGKVGEWPQSSKPHLPNKIINSIYSMRHYADIIYRLFPIVVTHKGKLTRRVYANRWALKKLGFGYEITKYDIDDGVHRAVTFALMGIKKIKCFVGLGLNIDTEPETKQNE